MKGVSIARLVPGEATSRVSIPVKRKEEAEASGGRRTGAEGFWNARRLRRAAAVGEESGGFLRQLRCALARPGGEVDRALVHRPRRASISLGGSWVYQHPAHGRARVPGAAGLSRFRCALSDRSGPRGRGSTPRTE
jgi:hypothetical protein